MATPPRYLLECEHGHQIDTPDHTVTVCPLAYCATPTHRVGGARLPKKVDA
jgi:hypothetical protein